jgi:hypothetical protein
VQRAISLIDFQTWGCLHRLVVCCVGGMGRVCWSVPALFAVLSHATLSGHVACPVV